jgi:hypothetical protein
MQGKKGTSHECTHLNKWGHLYNVNLLLQVFDFLGEVFHFSQDLFKREYGSFIRRILSFSRYLPSSPLAPSSHEMRDNPFLGQYTQKSQNVRR